jgi:hypothetical protein
MPFIKISVEGLSRPEVPRFGPPFVPSKTIRVGFLFCAKLSRETAKHETTAAAPKRNSLRVDIEFIYVSLSLATGMAYRESSTFHSELTTEDTEEDV